MKFNLFSSLLILSVLGFQVSEGSSTSPRLKTNKNQDTPGLSPAFVQYHNRFSNQTTRPLNKSVQPSKGRPASSQLQSQLNHRKQTVNQSLTIGEPNPSVNKTSFSLEQFAEDLQTKLLEKENEILALKSALKKVRGPRELGDVAFSADQFDRLNEIIQAQQRENSELQFENKSLTNQLTIFKEKMMNMRKYCNSCKGRKFQNAVNNYEL